MSDVLNNPFIDGRELKSAALMNLESAWRLLGQITDSNDADLYRRVAYLYRGVSLRADAVALMPFEILRGSTVIDGSAGIEGSPGYRNAVKFLPSPRNLFGAIEAAITFYGSAYVFKVWQGMRLQRLRFVLPDTIEAIIDPIDGTPSFKRAVNGQRTPYTEREIAYFWPYDPTVEFGPASTSAFGAAASAAGVVRSVNDFATAYFKRGAIKATLLTTKGNVVETERERLRTWWQRVTGGKNAWGAHVVNADAVNAVIIGEGLSELSNKELSDEMREEVATALGIPHSILFSNSSNFATAKQDDLNFYQKTILPQIELIEEVLNAQVFEPMGYQLRFLPDTLDIFQEDEKERAASLSFLTGVLDKGPISLVAMQIMGYEVDPELIADLERIWADKAAMAEVIAARQPEPTDDGIAQPDTTPSQADIRALYERDVRNWQQKALKRLRNGQAADCGFVSEYIPESLLGAVSGALAHAKTTDDVRQVFESIEWAGYP